MSTRKIKDGKVDGEKVYFKGHAKATFMSDGRSVEEAINDVGNSGITTETDPIFSASAAAKITDSNISDWNGKQDKISVQSHGTSSTTLSIAPNVFHKWGTVSNLTITLTAPTNTSVYNEYMIQFSSGSTPTTLSVPSAVKWVSEHIIEANKTYQISIVDNIGLIVSV